jgi:hypothetical protein
MNRRNFIGAVNILFASSVFANESKIQQNLKYKEIYTISFINDFINIPKNNDLVFLNLDGREGMFKKINLTKNDDGIIFDGFNCSWKRIFDGYVNIKWFGAKGDGKFDDTFAFQKAIDSSYTIFVPEGHYIVSSTLTTESIFLQGEKIQNASIIEYTGDKGCLFKINGYFNYKKYSKLSNLTIKGNYTKNNNFQVTALFLDNDSLITSDGIKLKQPKEDIDFFIEHCTIIGFAKGINIYGRGLYIDKCTFSAMQKCVKINRHDPIREYKELDQKKETGLRAYWIKDCRFHSLAGGIIIENNGKYCETLQGLHFTDNYIDTPATIMNGACRNSLFNNNTYIFGDKNTNIFYSNFDWINVIINGNIFSSYDVGETSPGKQIKRLIMFDSKKSTISGLIISNNTINRCFREVIKINASTISHLNISNNIFNNVCIEALTKQLSPISINVSKVFSRSLVINNIVSLANEANKKVQSNVNYVLTIFGKIYYIQCKNNIFNKSILQECNIACKN